MSRLYIFCVCFFLASAPQGKCFFGYFTWIHIHLKTECRLYILFVCFFLASVPQGKKSSSWISLCSPKSFSWSLLRSPNIFCVYCIPRFARQNCSPKRLASLAKNRSSRNWLRVAPVNSTIAVEQH